MSWNSANTTPPCSAVMNPCADSNSLALPARFRLLLGIDYVALGTPDPKSKRNHRKERFFLVGQALGNRGFSLDPSFRKKLGDEIKVKIPTDAFTGMDYHLDWIAASVCAYREPKVLDKPFPNSEQVATGTQQDIDLLIAFEAEDHYCVVLLEAKGYDSWTNAQMNQKSQRLQGIFGWDGKKHPEVKPHFCLASPRRPERLETGSWPTWMRKDGDDPLLLA